MNDCTNEKVLATLGSGTNDNSDGWDLGEATNDLFFGKELRSKLLDDSPSQNQHNGASPSSASSTWSPTLSGLFASLTGRRKKMRRPSSAAAAAAVAAATAATASAHHASRSDLADGGEDGGEHNRGGEGSTPSSPSKRSFTAEEVAEMMRSGAAAAEAAFRAQGFASSVKRYSNYISAKAAEEKAGVGVGRSGYRSRSHSSGGSGDESSSSCDDGHHDDGEGGDEGSGRNGNSTFVRVPSAARRLWGPEGIVDPVIDFPVRDQGGWVSLPDGSSEALQLSAMPLPSSPNTSSSLSLPTTSSAASAAASAAAAAALSDTATAMDTSSSTSSSASSLEEAAANPAEHSEEVTKEQSTPDLNDNDVLAVAQQMVTESTLPATDAVTALADSFGAALSSISSSFQPLLKSNPDAVSPLTESSSLLSSSSSTPTVPEANSPGDALLTNTVGGIISEAPSGEGPGAAAGATTEAAAPHGDSVIATSNDDVGQRKSTDSDVSVGGSDIAGSSGGSSSGSVSSNADANINGDEKANASANSDVQGDANGSGGSSSGHPGSFDAFEDDHQGLDGSYMAPSAAEVLAATAADSLKNADEFPAETSGDEGAPPSFEEKTQEETHLPVSGEKVVLSPREK